MTERLTLGAVADKPGSSRANKTGSWRTFKPIINDNCIACGICVHYCPEACIELKTVKGTKTKSGTLKGTPSQKGRRAQAGKRAVIDYDFCKGCLICMGECPHKAIEQEMDKK